MSATEPPKAPVAPPPKPSGAASALRYTGIPPSWLQKRPKLPSRNWLIFWSVLGSLTSLYIYDRREAKRVRQNYVERVKWRAEEKLNPLELPRKVRVYACRWPGDDDHNRSMKYFRKYVKPILVAAAVDFEMINGNRHGGLARSIADKIKSQRRESLPPDHPLRQNHDAPIIPLPSTLTPTQQREREMQGGILIVGRHTLKEYLHGLRLGWTEGLDDADQEEVLAHQLAGDGIFDEPEIQVAHDSISGTQDEPEPLGKPSVFAPGSKSPLFSHVLAPSTPSPSKPLDSPQVPKSSIKLPVPHEIPPQPPHLLLPFQNLLGFRYIPHMIVEFFNERRRARLGAEAAYTLLEGQTRDFIPPEKQDELDHLPTAPRSLDTEGLETLAESFPTVGPQGGDLDFDLAYERYIPKSYNKTPKNIADARKKYYEALPGKLAVARSPLANDREPTKDEREHPPPSEVELTTERFKKELKWREDLDGWKLLKRGSGVSWDSRLANALRVYKPPSNTDI